MNVRAILDRRLMDDTPGAAGGAQAPAGNEGHWMDLAGLSKEFQSDPAIKDFKDVNSLAKAFKDTKKMVGGMIRIPGEDAGEADLTEFRSKLLENERLKVMSRPDPDDADGMRELYRVMGMPENPEGYAIAEGADPDRAAMFANLAHQAGITQKQFETVLQGVLAADNEAMQTQSANHEREMGMLQRDWGDSYQTRVARAAKMAELTKAPKQLIDAIKDNKANADTVRWLDKLAVSIGNEGNDLAKEVGSVEGDTLQEMMQKRDELTRKMQSDNMSTAEYQRALDKLVAMNGKIAKLRG